MNVKYGRKCFLEMFFFNLEVCVNVNIDVYRELFGFCGIKC